MLSHWADPPPCDCPTCAPRPPRLPSNHAERERLHDRPAPWPANPDGPVPFVMLRGRWLAQMGFCVGTEVKVEVVEGRIVIAPLGAATPPVEAIPTTLTREIHYTDVEAHTHITPSGRTDR